MRDRQRAIDLVGRRGWFYLLSLLILLPGVIALLIPPRLNLGIDFTSGSTFTVRFEEPVAKDELKATLTDLGHSEARVQSTGENEFIVRTKELRGATSGQSVGPRPPGEEAEIRDALIERLGPLVDRNGEVINRYLEFSSISATVSGNLSVQRDWPFICCGITGNAIASIVAASAAIFVYLWWSFRAVPRSFRFGAAAVIALVHDAAVVLGAFSILGKTVGTEIDIFFVAALLTVIGFSVHDSIVVFDRIRETVTRGEGRTFAEAVNNSLLQTLSRSLNTSLTLIFAVLALLLIGGGGIREFLWAMLIGTVVGAYSSIFVAAQILVSWDEGDLPRLFRRLFGRPEPEEEFEPVGAGE